MQGGKKHSPIGWGLIWNKGKAGSVVKREQALSRPIPVCLKMNNFLLHIPAIQSHPRPKVRYQTDRGQKPLKTKTK